MGKTRGDNVKQVKRKLNLNDGSDCPLKSGKKSHNSHGEGRSTAKQWSPGLRKAKVASPR